MKLVTLVITAFVSEFVIATGVPVRASEEMREFEMANRAATTTACECGRNVLRRAAVNRGVSYEGIAQRMQTFLSGALR